MDRLEGPEITGDMLKEVCDAQGRGALALWLVHDEGRWHLVVRGAVDGSEEHVLTYNTVISQVVRRKEETGRWRYEYEIAAQTFNSMFFKR
jgi:hypothetical protein